MQPGARSQITVRQSLMQARSFVADLSIRVTITLIYNKLNPGGTDIILFAALLERGIIPIVCRCRLCIRKDERFIRGSALFLSHLLVDVHPNISTDFWIHVPFEALKIVDFSRILKVSKEVFDVLGFDQNSSVAFDLQLRCRCGHPSYQGPLTFEQLVRILFLSHTHSFILTHSRLLTFVEKGIG